MRDADCAALLEWAAPRLGLRPRGFRRVRRQVCRRIARRIDELALTTTDEYRRRLESDPGEWDVLDALCRVTISRFRRDRGVFDRLFDIVLPQLARAATERGQRHLRAWCAGCASGEEAYTLVLGWHQGLAPGSPSLEVVGTEANPAMVARARAGRYPPSSLREVPPGWTEHFVPDGDEVVLAPELRARVSFHVGDVRHETPADPFDLVLCRNLAFNYFAEDSQRDVLARLHAAMHPGAALVIGTHEALPAGQEGFAPWDDAPAVHRKLG